MTKHLVYNTVTYWRRSRRRSRRRRRSSEEEVEINRGAAASLGAASEGAGIDTTPPCDYTSTEELNSIIHVNRCDLT